MTKNITVTVETEESITTFKTSEDNLVAIKNFADTKQDFSIAIKPAAGVITFFKNANISESEKQRVLNWANENYGTQTIKAYIKND